ncbi:MAG TPA: flagellar hook-associated protein FlgK [Bryobacteraceae bacterium]|nr:flagellar hook-associated protein FlgK [Bryobacteraceae bacterium]
MGSLFSALTAAGQSLQAFEQAINVTQNNVTNANSPGYAEQVPQLISQPFQDGTGLAGGVQEQTQDTRDSYADTAVQQQLSLQGMYQQLQTTLAPLQNVFDVSSSSPIPSALSQLFQSFSTWATQPDNTDYQSAVIDAAQQTATAFQQAASQLGAIQDNTTNDIQSTVTQINQDAGTIASLNAQIAQDPTPDAGLSAQLENTLENLSGLANIQTIAGIGGQVTVLLGGQTPLVIGSQVNAIQSGNNTASNSGNPGAAPTISIFDSSGDDITSQITSGSLAGLLSVRDTLLPTLIGGGQQVGGLNTLAQGLADTINNTLAAGSTTDASPYQPGAPLFTYNSSAPSGIASSLAVSSTITGDQLAAASPGPPFSANGTALALAGLDSSSPGPVDGQGFTQYFGSLTATVGNAVNNANTSATAQSQLVAQAQSLQQQVSGVSLDEEAVRLVQLQSSYQAASKVVTVIDQMMQSLMDEIPT